MSVVEDDFHYDITKGVNIRDISSVYRINTRRSNVFVTVPCES